MFMWEFMPYLVWVSGHGKGSCFVFFFVSALPAQAPTVILFMLTRCEVGIMPLHGCNW